MRRRWGVIGLVIVLLFGGAYVAIAYPTGGVIGQVDVTNGYVDLTSNQTVSGNKTLSGTTTLSHALAVTSGGTGANTASGARSSLGAAASGFNGDITALLDLQADFVVHRNNRNVFLVHPTDNSVSISTVNSDLNTGVIPLGTLTFDGGLTWTAGLNPGPISAAAGFSGPGTLLTALNGANLTAGTVGNAALANSSVTVSAGTGLSGGGAISLGGSATVSVDQSFAPTWTGLHTFSKASTGVTAGSPNGWAAGMSFTGDGLAGGNTAAPVIFNLSPTMNLTSTGGANTSGYTALLVNVTETAVGSGTKKLLDLEVGGVSKASVTNAGLLTLATALPATSGGTGVTSLAILSAGAGLNFSVGGPFTAATAGTLALTNVGTAGSCGSATTTCAVTFDAQGRETAEADTPILGAAGKRALTVCAPGVAGCDYNLSAVATSENFNFGAVIPVGSRLLASEERLVAQFAGGGATNAYCSVDDVSVGSIFVGSGGLNLVTTPAGRGINNYGAVGSDQPLAIGGDQIKITCTSDVNLSTLTAGKVTVRVDYDYNP